MKNLKQHLNSGLIDWLEDHAFPVYLSLMLIASIVALFALYLYFLGEWILNKMEIVLNDIAEAIAFEYKL